MLVMESYPFRGLGLVNMHSSSTLTSSSTPSSALSTISKMENSSIFNTWLSEGKGSFFLGSCFFGWLVLPPASKPSNFIFWEASWAALRLLGTPIISEEDVEGAIEYFQ